MHVRFFVIQSLFIPNIITQELNQCTFCSTQSSEAIWWNVFIWIMLLSYLVDTVDTGCEGMLIYLFIFYYFVLFCYEHMWTHFSIKKTCVQKRIILQITLMINNSLQYMFIRLAQYLRWLWWTFLFTSSVPSADSPDVIILNASNTDCYVACTLAKFYATLLPLGACMSVFFLAWDAVRY